MDKDTVKTFADKVFADMAGAMTAGMGYVGTKTGLFRSMAGKGPMHVNDVVRELGLMPRYVEEWLKGMTCAKYLEYDPVGETYRLPDEHAFLLASDDTDHFMGGLFSMVPVLLRVAPDVATAFAQGGGVRFEEFGSEGIVGLDLINRGQYEQRLTSYWLKALPSVTARLEAGARVLDVGCGAGRVCTAIARDFPQTRVIGIDPDKDPFVKPKRPRPQPAFRNGSPSWQRPLTISILAIPLTSSRHAIASTISRRRNGRWSKSAHCLKQDGTVFIVEPKAADRLEDNINPIATMFYGFSLFHCMTQSLANGGPGLGTCLGPTRTQALVRGAGFGSFDQLDIRSPANLFYAARP